MGPLVAAVAPAAVAMAVLYRPFAEQVANGAYGDQQVRQVYNPMMVLLWQFPWINLRQNFLGTVGPPFLLLALIGVLGRARRSTTAVLVVLAAALLTLGPALTLGHVSIPLPWAWLAHLVPGFGLQRHPYLTVTLTGIGLAMLAGHGAAWLVEQAPRHGGWRMLAFAMVGWAVLTYWTPLPTKNVLAVAGPSGVPEAYRWRAIHGIFRSTTGCRSSTAPTRTPLAATRACRKRPTPSSTRMGPPPTSCEPFRFAGSWRTETCSGAKTAPRRGWRPPRHRSLGPLRE